MRLKSAGSRDVLRPVMKVFSEAIRGSNVRILGGRSYFIEIGTKHLNERIRPDTWMQKIFGRRFHRFVMFGERTLREIHCIEFGDAFSQHDERAEIVWCSRSPVVWDVTDPC